MIKLEQALEELEKITWAYEAEIGSRQIQGLKNHEEELKPIAADILRNPDCESILRAFFLQLLDRDSYAYNITKQQDNFVKELMLANVLSGIKGHLEISSSESAIKNLKAKLYLSSLLDAYGNELFIEAISYLPKIALNPFITQISSATRHYSENFSSGFTQLSGKSQLAGLEIGVLFFDSAITSSVEAYSEVFNRISTVKKITAVANDKTEKDFEAISELIYSAGVQSFLSGDYRTGVEAVRTFDFQIASQNKARITPFRAYIPVDWSRSSPLEDHFVLDY